jgi:membrane protein DedA with SNARE-associated domain
VTVVGDLLDLIGRYGYLVIFLGVMAESAGVPLPGETVLIVSGALAHRGVLDLGGVLLFGILGAVTGDQVGYWIGRMGGRPFVLRWGRYLWITGRRLARAQAFFDRHGGRAVFFARFITGLRVFGALAAGTSRMPWGRFALYNALGGAVWATAAVSLGYFLWASVSLVEHWVGRASLLLVALLVLILGLRWAYRRAAGDDVAGNDQPGDRTP